MSYAWFSLDAELPRSGASPKCACEPQPPGSHHHVEQLCDGPPALLLSCRSVPCKQLHILLKFKDPFAIVRLDFKTILLCFLSLALHLLVCDTPNPTVVASSRRHVHSPRLRCLLRCVCVFHLSHTPIQEIDNAMSVFAKPTLSSIQRQLQ